MYIISEIQFFFQKKARHASLTTGVPDNKKIRSTKTSPELIQMLGLSDNIKAKIKYNNALSAQKVRGGETVEQKQGQRSG